MTSDNPNLLPDRHTQHDLFICDVVDAALKDLVHHMEHPFFSLSKKPDLDIRRYEHNGVKITVTPSVNGIATIYDKDILIYCISQVMAKLNRGEKVVKRVRINTRDLLHFANRGTSGRDYTRLVAALERIRGTTITTNIRTGNEEQVDTFGLIDSSSVRRTHGMDGRLVAVEVTLSDWVFNAIRHNEMLTLHRDYFRLRKPTERRLYELARKHCGNQPEWRVSLELLLKKSGARTSEFEFRRAVRELVEGNHLPDYTVEFDDKKDQAVFRNRNTMPAPPPPTWDGPINPDVYGDMKNLAIWLDVYRVEHEWRLWLGENEIIPANPEKHLLKFTQTWIEKHGAP